MPKRKPDSLAASNNFLEVADNFLDLEDAASTVIRYEGTRLSIVWVGAALRSGGLRRVVAPDGLIFAVKREKIEGSRGPGAKVKEKPMPRKRKTIHAPAVAAIPFVAVKTPFRKTKAKVVGRTRVAGLGRPPSFTRPRSQGDSCWKPLTSHSRACADEAQSRGVLFYLDGELRCECGAHVGARAVQRGFQIVFEPTFHYPHKPARPVAPAKVFQVKRLR
jgi:hypothetical protein